MAPGKKVTIQGDAAAGAPASPAGAQRDDDVAALLRDFKSSMDDRIAAIERRLPADEQREASRVSPEVGGQSLSS